VKLQYSRHDFFLVLCLSWALGFNRRGGRIGVVALGGGGWSGRASEGFDEDSNAIDELKLSGKAFL